ncbi:MAG TPA: glycosyltransferase family 87 protein [Vicinamibacterales bacterium]|nr:glycosyltransferase family 87 protein [Vicinamibacterales bacterium]
MTDGRGGRAAAIALVGLLVLGSLTAPRFTRGMRDFEVYHLAAQRAAAGEPLYRTDDEHYQFKYLPAFAVLARPLGAIPLHQAKLAWFLASLVLLHLLVLLSLQLLPERRLPGWLLAVIVVVAMSKFFGHELVLGQANLLLGTMIAAATLCLHRGRDAAAGALLAAAVIVKPYAGLFIPWIAAQRRWRAVLAAGAGAALAMALPLPVYGPGGMLDLHAAWWETVTTSTAPNLLNQDNVSLAAMFAKWLGPGPLAGGLAALGGLVLLALAGAVFARRRRVNTPESLEAALLLTLLPLLSPQGWDYVFLLSTPAIVMLANYHDVMPAWLRLLSAAAVATIGLSLFDLLGRERYAAFMALSVITVCYLIIVAVLAWIRFRRIA